MTNSISVVVPIHNEFENIPRLYAAVEPVLSEMGRPWELLLVDDGSTDGSKEELAKLAGQDRNVKVIEFRNNFGQTAAMAAGIRHASGEIIVTMDGDLQNDPTDIPMMVDKLEEGYDLVHGWRKNRQDTFINRKLPSKCANWLISKVTGFPVHDLGCTLKAVRREVAQEIELFGDMHRFIPILAHWRGAKCAEVVTKHHPRIFGETKYGISRTFKVLLDLITVKYLTQHLVSPMRLFGTMGLLAGGTSFLSGLATVVMKLLHEVDMTGNPLFMLTIFSALLGVQFFILGMLGELSARIYFEVHSKEHYAIRHMTNFTETYEFPRKFDEERAA